MWVKRYEGGTLEEALARVKQELGSDALILSTTLKKKKSWFQKGSVEVMAATEADSEPEIDEETLRRVFPHRQKIEQVAEPEEKIRELPTPTPRASDDSWKLNFSFLTDLGFPESTAKEITRRFIFDYPKEERRDGARSRELQARILTRNLMTLTPSIFDNHSVWTAIGAPGAGKTSCLVKLALSLKGRGYQVTLGGGDRRKCLGVREMATYARLSRISFSTNSHGSGLFFCDTPALTGEMDLAPATGANGVTFLVLDATSRLKELMSVVDNGRRYGPIAVAFTKLDLVCQPGVLFELLKEVRLPVLGASMDGSFRTPFRFFEAKEFGRWILGERGERR